MKFHREVLVIVLLMIILSLILSKECKHTSFYTEPESVLVWVIYMT